MAMIRIHVVRLPKLLGKLALAVSRLFRKETAS